MLKNKIKENEKIWSSSGSWTAIQSTSRAWVILDVSEKSWPLGADEFVPVVGQRKNGLSLARCHGRPVHVAGESRCVRVRVHAGAR